MNVEERAPLGTIFEEFINNGSEMFCAMRLAPTEQEHCQIYYDFMDPPIGATVVDLGCGIGGCGAYLQGIDPSLIVVNVVNDEALIAEMSKRSRLCINVSFECTRLPSGFADVAMFNESIGHGDLYKVLGEASRLLKQGGILTIKDFSPVDGEQETVGSKEWGYFSSRPDIVIRAAYASGLILDKVEHPVGHINHWDELPIFKKDVQSVFGEDPNELPLSQTLYRFVKGGLRGRT